MGRGPTEQAKQGGGQEVGVRPASRPRVGAQAPRRDKGGGDRGVQGVAGGEEPHRQDHQQHLGGAIEAAALRGGRRRDYQGAEGWALQGGGPGDRVLGDRAVRPVARGGGEGGAGGVRGGV